MANPSRPNSVPEGEPSVVVQVKQKHVERLCANQEKIRSFFSVELEPLRGADCASLVASYKVVPVVNSNSVRKEDVDAPEEAAVLATAATGHESIEDLAKRVQHYLDQVCVTEAEDSSYDSDCETDDTNHEQVSRTTSDTLGQEFAEYVSCGGGSQGTSQASTAAGHAGKCQQSAKSSSASQFPCHMLPVANSGPGYTSRLEFALKLGYTERLVQAALHRLGPNPTQNELLAELIKLGAQQLPCPAGTGTSKLNCDYVCDGLLSECPALSALGCSQEVTCGGEDAVVAGASCASSTSSSSCGEVLRPIVIDGSNVAMSHGNKQAFSCRGIKLCVDWFRNRGHKDIVVFVPKWRKESCSLDNPIKDQEILTELEREGIMVFTPSRFVGGKRMVCYDDRYILKLAAQNEGIVVSNDNYRDLAQDSEFKKVVEDRILMYSFVSDRFMPPDDPLGRSGPTLDNFLRNQPKKGDLPPPCPYGKKCTYGTKCKFNHPERGSGPHKSVSERLSEHAQRHLSARNAIDQHARTPLQGKSLSVPLNAASGDQCLGMGQGTTSSGGESLRKALCRTRSNVVTAETNSHYGPPFPSTPYGPCQQLQPLPSSGLCNRLPAWPPVGDPQSFPKSHSVENLPCENVPTFSIPSSPSQHQLGAQPASNYNQQRSVWPGRSSSNVSPSGMHGTEDADGVNLHRKLQRQLTLNPGGCDPRIYQIQRGMCGPQSQVSGPAPHSPHRPLEPSRSSHCGGTLWEMQQQQPHQPHAQHQNVTRIASAPDSSRPWHGGPPPASSSEPQINLWPPQHPVHMPSQQQQQQQLQEQRRRLHYHLASIFPEEQVQTVMQMYPDETNPQKICAAILSMFQKI